MSAATASVADVSRTEITKRDEQKRSGSSQTQCTPMPLPALGTQKIIQGNGTNVGTVISLQCPAKHKLVGSEFKCVMSENSTQWEGGTYCKPMSAYEDYGFRVAVLASIVSSVIILLMSMAFITCCLVDCIKEDKRKKQERGADMWQWEDQPQHQEDNRSRYSHKGRNNNNNNTEEKMFSLWDVRNPSQCENMRPCRCQQQYAYSPARNYSPTLPLALLPGQDYDQLLLSQNTDPSPPEYPGPPSSSLSTSQTVNHGLVQISAVGSSLVWQYGEHQNNLSGGNLSNMDKSNTRNINKNPKELSIRIISV